jgi:hypothetical protein
MTTTEIWTDEDLGKITMLALHRMGYSAPDSEVSEDMRDQAKAALARLENQRENQAERPGPAAQLRRLAIDAAGGKLSAKTTRDRASALGRMYAYVSALHVLLNAGIADEDPAPYAFTYEDPAPLAELVRFIGAGQAAELGLTTT